MGVGIGSGESDYLANNKKKPLLKPNKTIDEEGIFSFFSDLSDMVSKSWNKKEPESINSENIDNFYSDLSNTASKALDDLSNRVSTTFETVSDKAEATIEELSNDAATKWSELSDKASATWNDFSKPATAAWDNLKNFTDPSMMMLLGTHALTNEMKRPLDAVSNTIKKSSKKNIIRDLINDHEKTTKSKSSHSNIPGRIPLNEALDLTPQGKTKGQSQEPSQSQNKYKSLWQGLSELFYGPEDKKKDSQTGEEKSSDPTLDSLRKKMKALSEQKYNIPYPSSGTTQKGGVSPNLQPVPKVTDIMRLYTMALSKIGREQDPVTKLPKNLLIMDTLAKFDLSPFWNWYDNSFGTNFRKGYRAPEDPVKSVLNYVRSRKSKKLNPEELALKFAESTYKQQQLHRMNVEKLNNAQIIQSMKTIQGTQKQRYKLSEFSKMIIPHISAARNALGRAVSNYNPKTMNPVMTPIGKLFNSLTLGRYDPKLYKTARALRTAAATLGPIIAGKNFTTGEWTRELEDKIPSVEDSPGEFFRKYLDAMDTMNSYAAASWQELGGSAKETPYPWPEALNPEFRRAIYNYADISDKKWESRTITQIFSDYLKKP